MQQDEGRNHNATYDQKSKDLHQSCEARHRVSKDALFHIQFQLSRDVLFYAVCRRRTAWAIPTKSQKTFLETNHTRPIAQKRECSS